MSEIKLLPCPFCGGEAEFHRATIKSNGGWCDSIVVRCKECEARTNRVLYNKEKHGEDGEYKEASESWNTRKPMEHLIHSIELIRDCVPDVEFKNGCNASLHKIKMKLYDFKEEGGIE